MRPAVPLLIGHGGNTGSQSNATVIRALALGHLRSSDWLMVVYKVRWCIHCVQLEAGCCCCCWRWATSSSAGWLIVVALYKVRCAGFALCAMPASPVAAVCSWLLCVLGAAPDSAQPVPPAHVFLQLHTPPCRSAWRGQLWAAAWACLSWPSLRFGAAWMRKWG